MFTKTLRHVYGFNRSNGFPKGQFNVTGRKKLITFLGLFLFFALRCVVHLVKRSLYLPVRGNIIEFYLVSVKPVCRYARMIYKEETLLREFIVNCGVVAVCCERLFML